MSPIPNRTPRSRTGRVASVLAVLITTGLAAQTADSMYQPQYALPGGLSPRPFINSTTVSNDTGTVTINGLVAPLQLQVTDDVAGTTWENQGPGLPAGTYEIPLQGDIGFLRVSSPQPTYVGSTTCSFCHSGAHSDWSKTSHAHALDSLKAIGMDGNAYCLPCHVVGYGYSTGFKDTASTPGLGGVQCENCHGPGGSHMSNPMDKALQPKITIAAEVCGGCHTDAHHPTYDEWLEAGHSHVSEEGMFNAGVNRMYQCGTCHSGAVRNAVVTAYDEDPANTDILPPSIDDANHYGQVCSTCHDPHNTFTNVLLSVSGDPLLDENGDQILAQPAQLRNPIGSAKFMSYATSTSPTNFAAQYDPEIQLCGQCHNERGATWANTTSRPPHHSPQYNILIGQVVDPSVDTNNWNGMPMAHGDPTTARPFGNPYQCTACHNRAEAEEDPTPANPNYTGHTFEVQTLACAECHGFLDDPNAEEIAWGAVEFIQAGTKQRIQLTMDALNNWATNNITDLYVPGSTNYVAFIGANDPATVVPWEFTNIGQLNTGMKSPGSAGQARLPDAIKQSRFLLYLVEHDASYGVHNVYYVREILDKARVLAETAPVVPAE